MPCPDITGRGHKATSDPHLRQIPGRVQLSLRTTVQPAVGGLVQNQSLGLWDRADRKLHSSLGRGPELPVCGRLKCRGKSSNRALSQALQMSPPHTLGDLWGGGRRGKFVGKTMPQPFDVLFLRASSSLRIPYGKQAAGWTAWQCLDGGGFQACAVFSG